MILLRCDPWICRTIASQEVCGGFRSRLEVVGVDLSTAFAHIFVAVLELKVLNFAP